MRTLSVLMAALALAGCAHRMVGQPVQSLVDEYRGPPAHIFDREDGRRVFQWWWSDVLLVDETAYDGSPEWWTSNHRRIESHPMDRSCATDAVARWDENRKTWIIERVRGPTRDCSMRR